MSAQQTPLTRLPAQRRGVIRRASLWDAGDHLLSVSGTVFSERYRRFYYRDIRAIVLQKGPQLGSIGALVLSLFFSLGLLLIAANSAMPGPIRWLWLVPLAGAALLLVINVAGGCRVFIYTAVSSEEVPAIFLKGTAKRVFPKILAKVQAAQGDFEEAYHQAAGAMPVAAPPPAQTTLEAGAWPRSSRYVALCYFTATLMSAVFAYWYSDALLTPKSVVVAKTSFVILNALGVVSGIWALSTMFRVRLFTGLRACIFAGVALLALRAYALYFTFVALRVRNGMLTETMPMVRWRHGFGTFDCAASTIIAIAGLIFLTFAWQDERQAPLAGDSLSSL